MSARLVFAAKIGAALRNRPPPGWIGLLGVEVLWLAPVLGLLGLAGGFIGWNPIFDIDTLAIALIAIVSPSLGEELLFRAALLPRPEGGVSLPWCAVGLSTALFVLWHPLQGMLADGEWGKVMSDPWFLACTAAVGIACTRVYWKTASIWPAVLLHWFVVVCWKALFDAPMPSLFF